MSRFGRILVAFDGSDPARHALDAALDLARDLDAGVEVLAVGGHLPRYAATVGEVDDAVHERDVFFASVLADARALAAAGPARPAVSPPPRPSRRRAAPRGLSINPAS